jgi:hypothetical protein
MSNFITRKVFMPFKISLIFIQFYGLLVSTIFALRLYTVNNKLDNNQYFWIFSSKFLSFSENMFQYLNNDFGKFFSFSF